MMKIRRILLLAAAAYGVYAGLLRRRHLRWGASEEDAQRPLPGDDLVPHPKLMTTRAVIVRAPASDVWPWIVQMGQGRGGLYSYDWLENLFGLDFHSADHIVPELQNLAVGDDVISLAPDNAMPLRVEVMEPPRTLVLRTGNRQAPVEPGDYFKGEIAGTWAFNLEDISPGVCRLCMRWRADWRPGFGAWAANHFVLEPVQFLMERRMLLGIKERAEHASEGSGRRTKTHGTARHAVLRRAKTTR